MQLHLYYPNSFLKLLFVGFSLVALPLVAALVNNAVSVDRLAGQSQKAVYQAVQAARNSRMLVEQLTAMERSARQFMILGDRPILARFDLSHRQFEETAGQLQRLSLGHEQMSLLNQLVLGTRELYQRISSVEMSRAMIKEAVEDFVDLSELAKTLDAQGAALVDREVQSMQEVAERAQRIVVWQLLGLLPVAFLLVLGFTPLIAKPIRQIDAAIRRLGEGAFSEQITVEGPQDLERLGKQLDWLRLRLVELEEQKTKFMRHVSHELKTPLTALREGAELLSEERVGPLNGNQREISGILCHNSVRLQKLIEDLLNYHTVQFQKTDLNISSVQMRTIITKVVHAQKLALLTNRLRLELDCPGITLEVDAEKLRIIVDNLVSNAVKFSPAGGRIRIAAREQDEHVILDVADSGPGIAREDRDKVFDAFYQGQIKHAGHVQGTGLGLSIVWEYTIAHHGTIEIVDNPAGGAHFQVTLPKVQSEAVA